MANWSQYSQIFGEFAPDCHLGHAVYGYFLNGGGAAYIVRVGGAQGADDRGPAALGAGPNAILGTYRVVARELPGGELPDDLSVEVTDPPEGAGEDRFNLVARSERSGDPRGRGTRRPGRAVSWRSSHRGASYSRGLGISSEADLRRRPWPRSWVPSF